MDEGRPGYPISEAAKRAGLEPAYLEKLAALGLVTRPAAGYTKGQIRRARLVDALERAGIPLEGLADAVRTGELSLDFVETPSYESFAALSDETFAEASARTGVPFELLAVIREALGLSAPTPDDRVREDEARIVPFVATQLRLGFRAPAIERLLRVTGESLRRVAEQESNWWRTEVIEPAFAAGRGDKAANPFPPGDLEELLQHAATQLLAMYDARRAHAWTSNIIDGLERELVRLGLFSRVEHPPAVAFLDITGYTRLTQERGDEAAAALAQGLNRLVQRAVTERRGRPIKWLGDGVMLYFEQPAQAVDAAIELVDAVVENGLPPAHIGIESGPVLFQEGDYFGATVNVASRIAEYARPREVLVSERVVNAVGADSGRFTEIGPVELKGVGHPLRLFSVARGSGGQATTS